VTEGRWRSHPSSYHSLIVWGGRQAPPGKRKKLFLFLSHHGAGREIILLLGLREEEGVVVHDLLYSFLCKQERETERKRRVGGGRFPLLLEEKDKRQQRSIIKIYIFAMEKIREGGEKPAEPNTLFVSGVEKREAIVLDNHTSVIGVKQKHHVNPSEYH